MRKEKRWLACLLAVAMIGTALTGCGAQTDDSALGAAAETAEGGTAEAGTAGTEAEQEPVQMEWLVSQTSAEVDDDAEVVKMVEERFNIDLKTWYVDPNKFTENLNVRFAGGEMPDVLVVGGPDELANYVEGGIIGELPIDVIREKAPTYAKIADENDDGSLWSTMIYNGKNYGVTNPMMQVPLAIYWRQDWLDKVGKEIPTTLDEFEDVMLAFVNEDPDGNGKDDTAGMAERTFGAIFGAYGLRCTTGTAKGSGFTTTMQLGDDNVPFFPFVRPEAKEVLAKLHDWYEKGIIDKEFITGENHGGYAGLSHSFMNGKIGVTVAQPYHYLINSTDTTDPDNWGVCMKELMSLNPDAQIAIGPAPIGYDGQSGTEAAGKYGRFTCLTTKAVQDPRKVDAFLAMLDAYYSDMEYTELVNYGIEGKHFKETPNGKKRIMEAIELRKEGVMQVDFGNTIPYAENITPQKTKFGKEVTGNGYYQFNVPPVEAYGNVIATLDTLTEQAYFSIITGEKPIDYFDTYVEEFKAAGGEEAEKAVQEEYAARLEAARNAIN